MEAKVDHYATLQVSADADQASLRRAYRAQMRRFHPDVNRDADAETRCHAINEAYECLRDPARRADYDAMQRVDRQHARHQPAYQRRHRRPDTPLHAYTPRYSVRVDQEFVIKSRWRKLALIALGLVTTLATFTATAYVDLRSASAARGAAANMPDVVMKPELSAVRR